MKIPLFILIRNNMLDACKEHDNKRVRFLLHVQYGCVKAFGWHIHQRVVDDLFRTNNDWEKGVKIRKQRDKEWQENEKR